MAKLSNSARVLAIDPSTQGFGFVVLEGRDQLIDWGTREALGARKNEQSVRRTQQLIEKYRPEVIVLEDTTAVTSRRHTRIVFLIRRLQKLAQAYKIRVRFVSKRAVYDYFTMGDRINQRKLAEAIACLLPELASCLPQQRKPWMSEDPRVRVFGAAGMGLSRCSQLYVGPPTPRPVQSR